MEFKSSKHLKSVLLIIILLFIINFLVILTPNHAIAESDSPEPDEPEATLKTKTGADYVVSEPGEIENYNLLLKNEGGFPETFLIDIEPKKDWIDLSDTSVTLAPGRTKEIVVTFELPSDLPEEHYRFYLNVTSRSMPAGEIIIHVIASQQDIIITAAIKPVLIIAPTTDYLGTISPGEQLEVDIEVNCYVVSAQVYLDYELEKILDSEHLTEKELTVSIEPDSITIQKGDSYDFTMTIEFSLDFDKIVNYTSHLRIQAEAIGYDAISKPVTLNFLVRHEPDKNAEINILGNRVAIAGISTIFIIGVLGAVIGSSEVGKYRFLALFFIPLYTKLHKNKILDHFTRGRVYEHIRNNPGVHYSEIKRELGLNNGNLTYHLHTLAREELIRSRASGRFKLFFPTDVKIPKDMEPQISSIRRQILDIIREEPGITQKEIGLRLPNKKQRTISYHVKNMSREGVIRLDKDGRETKCYITDKVIEMKQTGVVFKEAEEEEPATKYSDSVFRQI